MLEIAPKESYSRREVLRMVGISERQLRGWEVSGFIQSRATFAFADLIALRTLTKLRNNKVSPAQIRAALAAIRKKLGEVSDPLKELKVVMEGKKIHVQVNGQQMEPFSGQLLFNFDRVELKHLVSFPSQVKQKQKTDRETAERWFQKGLELEQTGASVEEAIRAYETAAKLDPTSAGALVNLGTIYFNRRRWGQADIYYKRALEADPEYALAHFNIGNLYDERGDTAKALAHYKSAVRLSPGYADAHYNLALLHQGEGRVMDAVRHWNLYLKLDPGSEWGEIARRELQKLKRSAVVRGRKQSTTSLG